MKIKQLDFIFLFLTPFFIVHIQREYENNFIFLKKKLSLKEKEVSFEK